MADRSSGNALTRTVAWRGLGLLVRMAMLIVAGLIEAFVTPHFDATVRWSVAVASAAFIILYFGLAGRIPTAPSLPSQFATEGNR